MITPNELTEDEVYNKKLYVMISEKQMAMLKRVAVFYRMPNNLSHVVRLMIEDKFKEIV